MKIGYWIPSDQASSWTQPGHCSAQRSHSERASLESCLKKKRKKSCTVCPLVSTRKRRNLKSSMSNCTAVPDVAPWPPPPPPPLELLGAVGLVPLPPPPLPWRPIRSEASTMSEREKEISIKTHKKASVFSTPLFLLLLRAKFAATSAAAPAPSWSGIPPALGGIRGMTPT